MFFILNSNCLSYTAYQIGVKLIRVLFNHPKNTRLFSNSLSPNMRMEQTRLLSTDNVPTTQWPETSLLPSPSAKESLKYHRSTSASHGQSKKGFHSWSYHPL